MKYIRTYGVYNSWKLDYGNPDRGFRLKPTLYRYPYTGYDDLLGGHFPPNWRIVEDL